MAEENVAYENGIPRYILAKETVAYVAGRENERGWTWPSKSWPKKSWPKATCPQDNVAEETVA